MYIQPFKKQNTVNYTEIEMNIWKAQPNINRLFLLPINYSKSGRYQKFNKSDQKNAMQENTEIADNRTKPTAIQQNSSENIALPT